MSIKSTIATFVFLILSECLFADNHVSLQRDDGHDGLTSSSVSETPEVSYGEQSLQIRTKDTKPYTIIIKDTDGSVIYSKLVVPTETFMEIFLPANINTERHHIEFLMLEPY